MEKRWVRDCQELILKLEIALSLIEKSSYPRGLRTGSRASFEVVCRIDLVASGR
ncbi:hypothetical protein Mal48_26310 [Thalassoglobus polymorphus]|uniref:Uncharacterized protein n=1 Tax=Thalassoglobus polymorphus TaxID=2527994 RepID=A0A517QNZ7_9PLAN|nr:hypothetical protein Mal48_26310 [Thalassoglobus polymorphus]